ncbi:ABC transporter permease [Aquamicrobium segne]|uniref:ABC transporter permease n=1 Tax=Aquamicrobium segne TaxID=469547 RepID=A0ABW0H162_9HYPH
MKSIRVFIAPTVILALAVISLFVGVSDVSLRSLWAEGLEGRSMQLLLASRLPRTFALVLAGAGMAVAGLLMQMLVRNRFVEPSTVGTMESASFGMLMVVLFVPDMPVIGRMLVAAFFALLGTALFLRLLQAIPLRSILMVPLVGILLSGVIGAVTTFFAYRYNLLQSLSAWTTGDFSIVLRGRYELLWLSGAMVILAYIAADRFTVAGLGKDFATNLGVNHGVIITLGLVIVSLVSASVLVSVGMIPFLGLVVPNIVSLMVGDNARRSLPLVALMGAGLVLACDIVGRIIIAPYEIPIGATMGVLGSACFLYLLLRSRARVA